MDGQLRKAYHNGSFKNRKELHKALESWNVKIEWDLSPLLLSDVNKWSTLPKRKHWDSLPFQPKESMILILCGSKVYGSPERFMGTREGNLTCVCHFYCGATIYPAIKA